ncbi:MAG: hypothetical protein AB7J35_07075 [Dehalococcoidia bacterium]
MNGRVRAAVELALISGAATLFLGMYLGTIGFGEAAVRGDFGPPTPRMIQRADEFGVLWRHGQIWWPIYVPGFFVAAFAVAPSVRHGTVRALANAGSGLICGWVLAAVLAPPIASFVAAEFAARNGLPAPAAVWVANPVMGYPAAVTFIAWTTLVLGFGVMLREGRWRIFAAAGALYVVVAGIRGSFAFGELARTWFAESRSGDAAALFSLLAAGASGAVLAHYFASPATIGPRTDKTARNRASTP